MNYFKLYKDEKENIPIIEDIIKMFLFIKEFIYDSKFYIESNSKDFFNTFKTQLIFSKYFYEESLKKIAMNYLIHLYEKFELMKIKIFQDTIDIKFT